MRSNQDQLVKVVLDVRPMLRASENVVVDKVLGRVGGVAEVHANPLAQTASVTYDRTKTSVEELRRTVDACGYHCAGAVLPPASPQPSPAALPEAG